MKFRVFVAVLAASLVAAGAAMSGNHVQILTGSFRTVISGKSSQLNGTWVLKIDQFGQSTTSKNGKVVVKGAVAATGGKFAITDTGGSAACTGIQAAGAYTYTLKSNQLKLTATFDQCSGRKTILTTHPLTKIGV